MPLIGTEWLDTDTVFCYGNLTNKTSNIKTNQNGSVTYYTTTYNRNGIVDFKQYSNDIVCSNYYTNYLIDENSKTIRYSGGLVANNTLYAGTITIKYEIDSNIMKYTEFAILGTNTNNSTDITNYDIIGSNYNIIYFEFQKK